VFLVEAGFEQERIVGSLLESDRDLLGANVHRGVGIDKVSEQCPGLRAFISLAKL
jgi:hypothetical protein